jgi:hypothetical protein
MSEIDKIKDENEALTSQLLPTPIGQQETCSSGMHYFSSSQLAPGQHHTLVSIAQKQSLFLYASQAPTCRDNT